MKVSQKKFGIIGIWTTVLGLMLLAPLVAPCLRAQAPPHPMARFGRGGFLGADVFSSGRVVAGAPYSAQAVTEHTQTLVDGNTIHTATTVNVYRDSQGRTRREMEVGIGPMTAEGNKQKLIAISDPVAGARYVLDPNRLEARQMPFRGHPMPNSGDESARHKRANSDATTESLGTQVIGGITAQGTRITRTIPAGQIGNQQPMEIVIERWYSPDLQTDVMRKETHPQFGTTVFQLTNIQRAEPQASLFQVPANYTLKAGRHAETE